MYIVSPVAAPGTAAIANCGFLSNTCSGSGGAIAVWGPTVVKVTQSALVANGALGNGGGLAAGYGAQLKVRNSSLSANTAGRSTHSLSSVLSATSGYGGAAWFTLGAFGTILFSNVTSNVAAMYGGSFAVDFPSSLAIQSSTRIASNIAEQAGGAFFTSGGAALLIQNSAIQNNSAVVQGGFLAFAGAPSNAPNVTLSGGAVLSGNSAPIGGLYCSLDSAANFTAPPCAPPCTQLPGAGAGALYGQLVATQPATFSAHNLPSRTRTGDAMNVTAQLHDGAGNLVLSLPGIVAQLQCVSAQPVSPAAAAYSASVGGCLPTSLGGTTLAFLADGALSLQPVLYGVPGWRYSLQLTVASTDKAIVGLKLLAESSFAFNTSVDGCRRAALSPRFGTRVLSWRRCAGFWRCLTQPPSNACASAWPPPTRWACANVPLGKISLSPPTPACGEPRMF